ncbi:hypothetical protein GWI33_003124 [Rhynchophorus ferrugineus]|uniref:Uncharacterized protein n=1 Tax=Rhynchophorus ferrugineus TaxID=354439 RepID=A0A834MJ79_RHYFE|nr:hypothetical protein GWI33_003124 [Rhynchophorus ferrugineus]
MPKPLHSQSQKLNASVIGYFEQERNNGGPLLPVQNVREVKCRFPNSSFWKATRIGSIFNICKKCDWYSAKPYGVDENR